MNGGYQCHWVVGDEEQDIWTRPAEDRQAGRLVKEEVCFGQRESCGH